MSTSVAVDPRVIVALDFPDADSALALSRRLTPQLCRVKVGKELFVSGGPSLVEALVRAGFSVFLDLKFHDIPNTVAHACKAAAGLGVWLMNVHASGGRSMLQAAREALGGAADRPRLIAVTVLTSLTAPELSEVGFAEGVEETAVRLARLTLDCGLDGVVCSALETQRLRAACGPDFLLVTPGIRPASSAGDDQKRVATPSAALSAGASYLVIGRPITRASDPLAALREIHGEIEAARRAASNG